MPKFDFSFYEGTEFDWGLQIRGPQAIKRMLGPLLHSWPTKTLLSLWNFLQNGQYFSLHQILLYIDETLNIN